MGNLIEIEEIPLQNVLFTAMMVLHGNVNTDSGINLIKLKCRQALEEALFDTTQTKYLDFDLNFDKFGDCVVIKANNIMTSLWFCGYYPSHAEPILETNKFYINDGYYSYSKGTKMLNFHKK